MISMVFSLAEETWRGVVKIARNICMRSALEATSLPKPCQLHLQMMSLRSTNGTSNQTAKHVLVYMTRPSVSGGLLAIFDLSITYPEFGIQRCRPTWEP
jgi:hypothetical protein